MNKKEKIFLKELRKRKNIYAKDPEKKHKEIENFKKELHSVKPICPECKKKDKVVKVNYKDEWLGYECERCYCVVKEIYYRNEKGKKVYR